MSLRQVLSMYMKRFSVRNALLINMERDTDMLRRMMDEARKTLKRSINTFPKLVRGRTKERPWLRLLMFDCLHGSAQTHSTDATTVSVEQRVVSSVLIYVGVSTTGP